MLAITDGKVKIVNGELRDVTPAPKPMIDSRPVEFSDDAEFSHLIRAEMGPRKVNGVWYYKSPVTTSDEMYLPPVYPRVAWPPEFLPPSDYPLNIFPVELTDALFQYAEEIMKKVNTVNGGASHTNPEYSGVHFDLPCIKNIFHGYPIERHTSRRGGNTGAKLVAIALYEDTKGYAKQNSKEKSEKISKQYKHNLMKLGKGQDFGDYELRDWYEQAWRSHYEHNCGEVIKSFTTDMFDVREKWCAECPYAAEKRSAFRDSQDGRK
jgi:hypothetical protein